MHVHSAHLHAKAYAHEWMYTSHTYRYAQLQGYAQLHKLTDDQVLKDGGSALDAVTEAVSWTGVNYDEDV